MGFMFFNIYNKLKINMEIKICKMCEIEKAKEYKENNKELVKEQKRNNYHKNKDNEIFKLKVKKK